jgi:hypothetical protein
MADRLDAILIKLGQVSGPAALKRWLDALSVRDGVQPPGDIAAPVTDVPVGTIELETDDLELHDTASGEIVAPSRRAAAGGESAVVASASGLATVQVSSSASYRPFSVAPAPRAASNGSGTGAATIVDNSFPVPLPPPTPAPLPLTKPPGPGNTEIPTRPVPLFAMLGDALEATPEPYLEIAAEPDYERREPAPNLQPVLKPAFKPIFEPLPIIHLPSPPGSKKKAEEVSSDEGRDADGRDKQAREAEAREGEAREAKAREAEEAREAKAREAEAREARAREAEARKAEAEARKAEAREAKAREAEAREAREAEAREAREAEAREAEARERERKPLRAIPIAHQVDLTPEDSHSLLSNYPPVSPVQRAITRFVTRIAVLAVLGGGLYFGRPYIVQRIPTWPWVLERVVRPVDQWLRHLPMRFAPSRIAPSAPTTLR